MGRSGKGNRSEQTLKRGHHECRRTELNARENVRTGGRWWFSGRRRRSIDGRGKRARRVYETAVGTNAHTAAKRVLCGGGFSVYVRRATTVKNTTRTDGRRGQQQRTRRRRKQHSQRPRVNKYIIYIYTHKYKCVHTHTHTNAQAPAHV